MGYPYWYLWRDHRLGSVPFIEVPFPEVPTLFLYGIRKRTMFHSEAFERRLNGTLGSRVARYDCCGHWLMHESPQQFNEDVQRFLQ